MEEWGSKYIAERLVVPQRQEDVNDIFPLLHIFRNTKNVKERDNELDNSRLDGWIIANTRREWTERFSL